jgi:uncharacterized membrane protein YedE/YeeE
MRTLIYVVIGILFGITMFKSEAASWFRIYEMFRFESFHMYGISRYFYGGIIFGLGWALAGACPGPMFTLVGAGFLPIGVVIISSLIGTYIYGLLKDNLPH